MTPAASPQRGSRTAAGREPGHVTVDIRPFTPADAEVVAALVREVFDEHVAASFEADGISEMYAYLKAQGIAERAQTHITLVAWQGYKAVGVIEVRNVQHVSMLFIRTSHMGRGIATELVARAEAACRAAGSRAVTVNSSLNAQGFYRRMGFVANSEPKKYHGFAFAPMEKRLSEGEVLC